MADEIDQANEQAERWLNQMIANRPTGTRLAPKGSCHYCEQEFDADAPDADKKLFCDSDCASDFEYEERLKGRR